MTLLLVRHGETALNAARVLQPAGTPLSPRGLEQAQAVARRLAGSGAAALVSSDLPRARQTADAIAQATGLSVIASGLLRERDYGDLRGRPYDSLGFDALTMEEAPPGGESGAAFRARAEAAFADLLQRRAALPGALIVVSHGLLIRALLDVARLAAADLPHALGNTAVCELQAEPPHAALRLNCLAHLDACGTGGLSGG